jgi:hypothetical protein
VTTSNADTLAPGVKGCLLVLALIVESGALVWAYGHLGGWSGVATAFILLWLGGFSTRLAR